MGSLKNKAHERIVEEQNRYRELTEKAIEKMTKAYICKTNGSCFLVINEIKRQEYHLSEQEKELIYRITSPGDE